MSGPMRQDMHEVTSRCAGRQGLLLKGMCSAWGNGAWSFWSNRLVTSLCKWTLFAHANLHKAERWDSPGARALLAGMQRSLKISYFILWRAQEVWSPNDPWSPEIGEMATRSLLSLRLESLQNSDCVYLPLLPVSPQNGDKVSAVACNPPGP